MAPVKRMWAPFGTHLLAGEAAEHGGDVAGVLRHHLPDGLLHSQRDSSRNARHDLLQLQQGQGRVPQGLHQLCHPFLHLWEQKLVLLDLPSLQLGETPGA